MKQVYNTLGENTTAGTWAYLQETPTTNLFVKDCVFIGPPINYPYTGQTGAAVNANYGAYPLVDGDYPISYQGITYQPFAIEKEKLEYKIGFEASTLSLTLRPREYPDLVGDPVPYSRGDGSSFAQNLQVPAPYTDQYLTLGTMPNSLQAFMTMRQGLATTEMYFAPITVTRMFMATPGDTTTYGGAVMFRGRLDNITIDRFEIKIQASSLMEIFTQKVPSQLIEPGNRYLAWNFSSTPDSSGSGTGGGFNWLTSSTSYDDDLFQEGWMSITVAGYGTWIRRVFTNFGSNIYLYEPIPINLSTPDLTITYQIWKAATTDTVQGAVGQGFPSVPKPEIGVL